MRKLLLLFLAIGALALQAQNNTTIQPDCLIPFSFTAAGNFPATTTNNGAGDNRTKGCAAWTLMYQNSGMTSVSVTLQSGSSVSTSVSFGSFAGTISMGYVNPIVSDTGGSLQATNGTADISWVRVHVAATGTGTLTGVLYGFRNSSAAVNGGGGGGGGICPQGPATAVQFSDGTDCQGSASFVWDGISVTAGLDSDLAPLIQGSITGAFIGNMTNGMFYTAGVGGAASDTNGHNAYGLTGISWGQSQVYGADGTGWAGADGAISYGLHGTAGTDGHAAAGIYGAYLETGQKANSGTAAVNMGYWTSAQCGVALNGLDYDIWADEQGVFRVKADSTFDSVCQAIPALYNPQFTKYTPGAMNYERIVEQWDANVAEIGTEKGGTGTLRNLRLLGTQVLVNSLKTTGAATGKTVVCVDVSTGQLYASTSGVACAN